MQIFGLEPVVAAIVIGIAGIAYSVILGYAKAPKEESFDGKKLATAILIGVPGAIIFVATGIASATPADNLQTLILVIGWLLQVSGTDSTIKSIGAIVASKNK